MKSGNSSSIIVNGVKKVKIANDIADSSERDQ